MGTEGATRPLLLQRAFRPGQWDAMGLLQRKIRAASRKQGDPMPNWREIFESFGAQKRSSRIALNHLLGFGLWAGARGWQRKTRSLAALLVYEAVTASGP